MDNFKNILCSRSKFARLGALSGEGLSRFSSVNLHQEKFQNKKKIVGMASFQSKWMAVCFECQLEELDK